MFMISRRDTAVACLIICLNFFVRLIAFYQNVYCIRKLHIKCQQRWEIRVAMFGKRKLRTYIF